MVYVHSTRLLINTIVKTMVMYENYNARPSFSHQFFDPADYFQELRSPIAAMAADLPSEATTVTKNVFFRIATECLSTRYSSKKR
ncbi:uncharacterized protein PHALS_14983 [Plasmopara halstedii]|uniref:Uncharacterized protein n=1 Tax=Plasmopara halstedii TaxID=4781 RepID=A0A0P1A835_PLAHL|nr:uncharacterized protein PHALS_14983 [Plasmopara halstedii]CEG36822.1 hypothetical protein PHALS_14983 [Plasmopara halstedii]|eukprot:XP_024573191.1 hypothetical protein PHALS_14983 [Plasmopara halstedii]